MEDKNTKKISINLGIIVISVVLILILIADIMIIITNKRNDEKIDQMTQNIITKNNELVEEEKEETKETNEADETDETEENISNNNEVESKEENVVVNVD